jgi:hypothetical protein
MISNSNNCNSEIVYNLSNIPGFMDFVKHGTIPTEFQKYYSSKIDENYLIVKYNKELLSSDLTNTYGLLRSVIFSGQKMVCYSPPKSLSGEQFMIKYPFKTNSIVAEEFIEGTMINVFFVNRWQIATRNTVGADVSFYTLSNITFHQMFMDACSHHSFNIETLNPSYCYSFVLQHSANRIVLPIKYPQLYLVGVYEIKQDDNSILVIEKNLTELVMNKNINVKMPARYEFSTYTELIETFASTNTSYDIMGVVINHMETGERTKIRNPIYEEVRQLRGNQPKLQYQYLCLRHSGKLPLFLKYYPETKPEMSKYRDQVHLFTETLHKHYISCYVKKEKPLKDYSTQYRTHMFKLHEHFITNLRPKGLYMTNTEVIKYVNQLHPSLLMYSLNYHMRKRYVDTIKSQV